MHFFKRAAGRPRKLAVFPGTFNPVTCAHLALAEAALSVSDQVLFVLPEQFPHKAYEGATFPQRAGMLKMALLREPRAAVASTEGGLFLDIARECRDEFGPDVQLCFVCGRDAAERIVNWEYPDEYPFREQLEEVGLLVASRQGTYCPPAEYADRIRELPLPGDYDEVSATRLREALAAGNPWEHLAPEALRDEIRLIYSRQAK